MRGIIILLVSILLPVTGTDIGKAIESTKTPKDIKSILSMRIVDSKGREKNKKIKMISKRNLKTLKNS